MQKVLEMLLQRRIWIAMISAIAFVLNAFGVYNLENIEQLVDNIMLIINAVVTLVAGVLAIWSFFKPKVDKK